MTKEEYQQLLQSDYWKGFSYALIKERDFTCQDCGRKFYNQRHLLNVHHLRYKEANPWSYDKHDLVVLCRECHEKRHGIYHGDAPNKRQYAPPQYERSAPPRFDSDAGMGGVDNSTVRPEDFSFHTSSRTTGRRNYYSSPGPATRNVHPKKQKNWLFKFAAVALVLLLVVFFSNRSQSALDEASSVNTEGTEVVPHPMKKAKSHGKKKVDAVQTENLSSTDDELEDVVIMDDGTVDVSAVESNIEKLEKRNHESVQSLARKEGVSTEGSTSDILNRINRKHVEEQARKEGVSTEGSTSDILSRINRKHVEEQARKEGVSTEGSTSDILSRINRKHLEALGG